MATRPDDMRIASAEAVRKRRRRRERGRDGGALMARDPIGWGDFGYVHGPSAIGDAGARWSRGALSDAPAEAQPSRPSPRREYRSTSRITSSTSNGLGMKASAPSSEARSPAPGAAESTIVGAWRPGS